MQTFGKRAAGALSVGVYAGVTSRPDESSVETAMIMALLMGGGATQRR